MDITVRRANKSELDWINLCYREVNFLASDYETEIIAIVEVEGEKAGLGRLVKINNEVWELGGMLVLEGYRSLGLSKKIIKFLLEQVSETTIYCIPFENLFALYNSMGFEIVTDIGVVPKKVIDKFEWCKKTYPTDVLLLKQVV